MAKAKPISSEKWTHAERLSGEELEEIVVREVKRRGRVVLGNPMLVLTDGSQRRLNTVEVDVIVEVEPVKAKS